MATTAERLTAAEEENALQKAQIDILEAKLVLVLDYLDQRVVDRLSLVEIKLNQLAIGALQLRNMIQIIAQKTDSTGDYNNMAQYIALLNEAVRTEIPYEAPFPPRSELEAQIVSPPITPAPEEPEA